MNYSSVVKVYNERRLAKSSFAVATAFMDVAKKLDVDSVSFYLMVDKTRSET